MKRFITDLTVAATRPRFVLGFVTKRLLQLPLEQASRMPPFIARDDTHKVNWNGFPVEIPGTVDIHQHVHPYGVFVKSHEDTLACLDVMFTLDFGVHVVTGCGLPMRYFIQDRAWAFLHSNMMCLEEREHDPPEEEYESYMLSCYAHFMRAVNGADTLMEDITLFGELQQDLREVHNVTWKCVGENLWSLFCDKWERKGELAMLSYLSKTYGGAWGNWKLYSTPRGLPVHNNGIEGLNGAFKINGTGRERADLGTFSASISRWVLSESFNTGPLPSDPFIPPSTWRDAQLLESGVNSRVDFSIKASVVMNLANVHCEDLSGSWLMPSAVAMKKLSAPTAAAKRQQLLQLGVKFIRMLSGTTNSTPGAEGFHVLVNTWKSFYILRSQDVSPEIKHVCPCPMFHKTLQCPHSLALSIRYNGVEIPLDRSLLVLGHKKRQRGGRYAKASAALVRQDGDGAEEDAGTAFACSQATDPCCYYCGQRNSKKGNLIVFCDGCDMGVHQRCLVPPMKNVPVGDWFCGDECKALKARLDSLTFN